MLRFDGVFEEFKTSLDKRLETLEEDITAKKQRKFIRDFKDYQSGRILSFHRKYDHMYGDNQKNVPENQSDVNIGDQIDEVEENDVSDSNQSDISDSVSGKSLEAEKSSNKSNFLKQFCLLNQGRTERKEPLPQRNRGRGMRGKGRGTTQRKYEEGKEDLRAGGVMTRARKGM
ncbi:hypothetical protein NDU88_006832 [Pleurodeles waltl]|uniref:Uncharacterized protein n=1 Tax=Pleurodeles waltl TaxID=8319 RepID=A0AAV7SQS3_PLEWA|nr:hypothetical protein NDU88_006832 [Pleurodeles waltl]